jgi:hypothetical protein
LLTLVATHIDNTSEYRNPMSQYSIIITIKIVFNRRLGRHSQSAVLEVSNSTGSRPRANTCLEELLIIEVHLFINF